MLSLPPFDTSVRLVCLALLGVILLRRIRAWAKRRSLPLPPGPDARWFAPGARAPIELFEMTKTYGPVFSFRQGSELVVVVGGYQSIEATRVVLASGSQAAVDILQKRGADLADRPRAVAAGELLSGGMRTLLVHSGERLRRLRRALHAHLQPTAAVQYKQLQHRAAVNVVLDVLREPEEHINHAKRFAASLILTMTYGKTTPTQYTDPEVQEVQIHTTRLGKVMPTTRGSHIVDRYPIFRFVPFVANTLRRWHDEELELFERMVQGVREDVKENNAQPSFVTYLLNHQEEFGLGDDELAYLAGSMFGAGSDSTATAITFVIMAAATYPHIQADVQAQLDEVIGRDRVPTFEDEKLLPLVVAFFLETFRWRPISWGGVAHRATSDIVWNEYVIPAGTTVYGNHWAIGRDTEVFPDPDEFRPSRWLDVSGKIRDDISFFNYGFGRRVCPGQHVANNSVFINTALLLWAFDIRQDVAAPIDTMEFTDSGTVRPLPFKAVFTPRIDRLRELFEAQSQ